MPAFFTGKELTLMAISQPMRHVRDHRDPSGVTTVLDALAESEVNPTALAPLVTRLRTTTTREVITLHTPCMLTDIGRVFELIPNETASQVQVKVFVHPDGTQGGITFTLPPVTKEENA